MSMRNAVLLGLLIVLTSCNVPAASVSPVPPTETAVAMVVTPLLENTQPAAATPSPQTPASPTADQAIVLFDAEQRTFVVLDSNGTRLAAIAAPFVTYPDPLTTSLAGSSVYLLSAVDHMLMRAQADSLMFVEGFQGEKVFAIAVRADEQKIAWSTVDWQTEPPASELWVSNLDGSEAQKIAQSDANQNPVFALRPIRWMEDGELLYEYAMMGLGGYILYGGYADLYGYDLNSGQTTTYVSLAEQRGPCLDSFRLDLNKVIFNCDANGPAISIRALSENDAQRLPTVEGYPMVGAAQFSPNGERLAYGAARGEPDNQQGLLLLTSGGWDAAPLQIATIDRGYFPKLLWLDDDTLIASTSELDSVNGSVLVIETNAPYSTRTIAKGVLVGLTLRKDYP